MTVNERALLNAVRVETFNIGEPAPLVLDYSRLDVAILDDGTADPETQWTDWTPKIQQIDLTRGGRQNGIEIAPDTGVLTITLLDVALGLLSPTFLKGQRIRVVHYAGRHLFNGKVLDVVATTTLDKRGQRVPALQVTAVDAHADHDQITRYGALPPAGSETFTERIARLSQSATTAVEPAVLNREPTFTPWAEQRRNLNINPKLTSKTGWSVHATGVATPAGIQFDFATEVGRGMNLLYQAAAISSTAGAERSSSVEVAVPAGFPAVELSLVTHDYTVGGTMGPLTNVTVQPGQTVTIVAPSTLDAAGTAGVRTILRTGYATINPAGSRFIVRNALIEDARTPGVYFDGDTNPGGELERTRWLAAAGASASVVEAREFAGWATLPDTVDALGLTVYESSLANHFTLACNTAGAMWWVGADGVTRFGPRVFDEYTAVTFAGAQPPPGLPADTLHYLRPIASAGSHAFFNRAIMHNLGAAVDPESGEWVADDVDVVTVHLGSPYGFSYAEITINDSGATLGSSPVYDWLLPASNFAPKATGIVWNAQEDLDRIPELEIGGSVYLPTDSIDRDPWPWNVIIGIRHTITPTRWITELTLIGVQQP